MGYFWIFHCGVSVVGVASRLIIAVARGAGKHQQQQERIQLEDRRLTTAGRTGRIVCFVYFVRKNSDVTHPVFFLGPSRLTTTDTAAFRHISSYYKKSYIIHEIWPIGSQENH